ncbi:MAG: hypothetical protein ABW148_17620, partial [Sedimenticola sp.]
HPRRLFLSILVGYFIDSLGAGNLVYAQALYIKNGCCQNSIFEWWSVACGLSRRWVSDANDWVCLFLRDEESASLQNKLIFCSICRLNINRLAVIDGDHFGVFVFNGLERLWLCLLSR